MVRNSFLSLVSGLALFAAVSNPIHAQVSFTDVTADVIDTPASASIISSSLADYDNDGDLDVLYQGSLSGEDGRRFYENRLIENSGVLGFVEVTSTTGPIANDTTGWSAAWADVNGDGFVDVFLGEANPGTAVGDLFYNREGQSGRFFEDVSDDTIPDRGFHQDVAWADMNNDELLDLVIAMEGPTELHEIYLQDQDGGFTPVGEEVGIQVPFGRKAYGCAIGDPDNDGDLDIYISTCISGGNVRNNFFVNDLIPGGTLSFTDIADTNGTQYMDNSYHAEFQDFDNDGWVDLFMIGADGNDSKLWRNNQDGTWTDVDTINGAPLLSTNGGDFNGGRALDYDNDGDLDLFCHDHDERNNANIARALFRNDGNWQFTDVTETVGLLSTNEDGYDSSWGDIDNDGDLDLVSSGGRNFQNRIFLSDACENGNNVLKIRLAGNTNNTRGVGAKVRATLLKDTPDEVVLTRFANIQAGTFNQSDLPVHFGLGTTETAYDVTVNWPNGPEINYGDFNTSDMIKGDVVTLDINPPLDVKDGWLVE